MNIRSRLRAARRALPPEQRADAAMAVAKHLVAYIGQVRSPRIAAFCAADGEADPGPFMTAARNMGATLYLPVLAPVSGPGMRFVETEAGQPLIPNRFGIPEPQSGKTLHPAFLSLALVPLVGFDSAGNRLGMGAGYYDRCFGFLRHRTHWRRPRLVGVAYDFQQIDHIDAQPWDVPLEGVVTESGLFFFN